MSVSKTSDHIQIKINMSNPSQEPPASSKAPNEVIKDKDFLCISKIKRKRAKIWNMSVSKTNDHIQIKIKIPNPSQEPPASSKAPIHDSKDLSVLPTFKIKIESKNLDCWCIKDQ